MCRVTATSWLPEAVGAVIVSRNGGECVQSDIRIDYDKPRMFHGLTHASKIL